MVEAD